MQFCASSGLFKSRARLEAELLFLRHQLNVAIAASAAPTAAAQLGSRLHDLDDPPMANLIDAVQVVQPETVLRWQWTGFRVYWRWKSSAGRAAKD